MFGTVACGTVVSTQELLWFPSRVCPNRCSLTVGLTILAIVNNLKRKPCNHRPPFQQPTFGIFHKPVGGSRAVAYDVQNLLDQSIGTIKVPWGLCLGPGTGIMGARRARPNTVYAGRQSITQRFPKYLFNKHESGSYL